jgi:sec-independent protein translocase protein TatC
MPVVEHLAELRKRIIIVLAFFAAALIVGLILSPSLLNWFKQQTVAKEIDWNVFSFTDGIVIYFKSAFLVCLLFTLPVLLYQIWAFVKPALTEREAKGTLFYVPLSFCLFLIGVAFSYFVVFPMTLQFMSAINHSIGAEETYGLANYFTLMFNIIIPIAVVFELPVVVLFLTKMGILHPNHLRKSRKVAYFCLLIIGISLTPPDFVSDVLVVIPLLLLFEASIWCSAFSFRKQRDGSASIFENREQTKEQFEPSEKVHFMEKGG